MKITLTIEVDGDSITVAPNKEVPVVEEKHNDLPDEIPQNLESIGEVLPKGATAHLPRPRTDEYPFNVGDAKEELKKNHITLASLARCMGNFPAPRLRNIFRYDNRRFTREEYNVILKAIEIAKENKKIKY